MQNRILCSKCAYIINLAVIEVVQYIMATVCFSVLSTSDAYALPGGIFGESEIIWLSGVECKGHETTLLECENQGGPGVTYPCAKFSSNNAVGVVCGGKSFLSNCNKGTQIVIPETIYQNHAVQMSQCP